MKTKLTILCTIAFLLVLPFNSFSQLGESYLKIKNTLSNDKEILKVETISIENGYLIKGDFKEGNIISTIYYFTNDSDIAYLKKLVCNNSTLNATVKTLNEMYVKVADLSWKDYESKMLINISTTDYFYGVEFRFYDK